MTTSRYITLAGLCLLLTACSLAKLSVRASMPMIEGGMQALYMETDLALAEGAFPANIELLEGMLINDPSNRQLHEYAAQAYYGYAYGFVEDENSSRASQLYQRGLRHGQQALLLAGADQQLFEAPIQQFEKALHDFDEDTTAALFWTASNWAKWVDMNRDQPPAFAQLPKAVALMERVMQLDEHYFMSAPHLFFAVYYGGRSPTLGGDFEKSIRHFNQAREATDGRLLLVDLLQAQYLDRQQFDQAAFHERLNKVLNARESLYPEKELINRIAKRKAALFLSKETEWF